MSNILILGSAGFVGSNLTNYLVQHTNKLIASVDNLSGTSDLLNLEPSINSKARHTFYLADANDADIMSKMLKIEKPQTIICNVPLFNKYNFEFWVKEAQKHKVGKLIFLVDDRVLYGKLTKAEQAEFHYIEESIGSNWVRNSTTQTYLLKLCSIFGPRQSPNHRLAWIMRQMLQDKEVLEEQLSDQRKDLMYVKDLFYVIDNIIKTANQPGNYTLFSDQSASELDIYHYLQEILSDGGYHEFGVGEEPLYYNFHQGYSYKREAQYGLEEALEHTLRWYDANRWAWREHE